MLTDRQLARYETYYRIVNPDRYTPPKEFGEISYLLIKGTWVAAALCCPFPLNILPAIILLGFDDSKYKYDDRRRSNRRYRNRRPRMRR
jgi:hypothetical protein